MATKEYVSVKEQARWIREALRAVFPGVRFSVRSSRGGGAVDVGWTDGPTVAQVQEVTRRYELEGFDGMTDMRYDVPLVIDGREYRGGGLILEHREVSDTWRAEILRELSEVCDREIPDPDVRDSGYWETRLPIHVDREGVCHRMVDSETEYVSDLVHRVTAQRSRL